MAMVRVHNITDRPNSPGNPYVVRVAKQPVRPGKFIELDSGLLSKKMQQLHGTAVWIGNKVPAKYRATSKSALRASSRASGISPMDIQETRKYLGELDKESLMDLCESIIPVLGFPGSPSKNVVVAKLARAAFGGSRELDPEKFFWLRRWAKRGDVFTEK